MSIEDKTIKQLSNSIKVLQKANSEIAEAYDKLKADYENRFKEDLVAMLTEIQLEIEENSYPEKVYGDEYGINEIISTDGIYQIIQQKINSLKTESEGEDAISN